MLFVNILAIVIISLTVFLISIETVVFNLLLQSYRLMCGVFRGRSRGLHGLRFNRNNLLDIIINTSRSVGVCKRSSMPPIGIG